MFDNKLFSNSVSGIKSQDANTQQDDTKDPFGFPLDNDDDDDDDDNFDKHQENFFDDDDDDDKSNNKNKNKNNKNNTDDEVDFSALFDNVKQDDDDNEDDPVNAQEIWKNHLEQIDFSPTVKLSDEDWEQLADRDPAPIAKLINDGVKKGYQRALIQANTLMEQQFSQFRKDMEQMSEQKLRVSSAEDMLFDELPQLKDMSKHHVSQAKRMLSMGLSNGLSEEDAVDGVREFFAAMVSKARGSSNRNRRPSSKKSSRRRNRDTQQNVSPAWFEAVEP